MAPEKRSVSARSAARTFLSRSSAATEALGEQLGRAIRGPVLIALDGELGAGKTCFVRGLARGLDVRDAISSPTYALLQSYSGRLDLHHLDAWMEGRERAFLSDGGLEWVEGSGVAVIEWAERVADVLPRPHLSVKLEPAGPEERRIEVAVRANETSVQRPGPEAAGSVEPPAAQALAAILESLHAEIELDLVEMPEPPRMP